MKTPGESTFWLMYRRASEALSCRIDLPSYARIPVDPPRAADARLPIENPKLVKSKLLLELASHRNARGARANDDDGIVCVSIVIVAVHSPDRFFDHSESQKGLILGSRNT